VLRRETSWARRKKEEGKGKMSPSDSQLRIAGQQDYQERVMKNKQLNIESGTVLWDPRTPSDSIV
jgi:hypothetical protein